MERAVEVARGLPVLGESVDRRAGDRIGGDYADWFEFSARGIFAIRTPILGPQPDARTPPNGGHVTRVSVAPGIIGAWISSMR
jgi:hypothetical protein